MADNLCGPSNGAKQLIAHTDRDRASQQTRFVNGPRGFASDNVFRQQPSLPNSNDSAFASFQRGVNPIAPSILGPPMGNIPFAFGPGQLAPNLAPGMPVNFASPTLASRPEAPSQAPGWVQQFSAMNITNQQTSMHPSSNQIPVHAAHPMAPRGTFGSPVHNLGFPSLALASADPMGMTDHYMPPPAYAPPSYEPPAYSVAGPPQTMTTSASATFSQATTLVTQELDDAFNNDADFEAAMNSWMGLHGEDGPMQAVENNMEALAEDLEAEQQREQASREQEDLARAASNILSAVAGNTSERFQQSTFLQTMRRIAEGQVVARNNDLVDAVTGESAVAPDSSASVVLDDAVAEKGVEGRENMVPGDTASVR